MAVSLDALLNIRANVQGEGAVQRLGSAIGGIKARAASTSGALAGLAQRAGGLGDAMGGLLPLFSTAGMVAMGRSAINAADDMNDMAQRTGVSVEQLSKFQQAANASGTNIEGVGKALTRLNRGLGELATTGGGPTAEALRSIGVSARDSQGKLLSADEVMLRVADKFKAMPDGAQKAAAAMAIFGKAGADMIPLLNGGRESVEGLTATMSTEFAQASDQLNDKMAALQTRFTTIGVTLGTKLMPAFTTIADGVAGLVDGFAKLPAPVQQLVGVVSLLAIAFVALAPAISAIVSLIGVIAPLFTGLVSVVATVGAAITALGGLGSVLGMVAAGLAALVSWPALIVAGIIAAIAAIYLFRDQIGAFFVAVGRIMFDSFNALIKITYDIFIGPYVKLWDTIKDPVMRVWSFIVDGVKSALRGLIGFWVDAINRVIGIANRGIQLANRLPGVRVALIGEVQVPRFAEGGFVSGPTMGLVGEAGPEYVIPARKMAAASAAFLGGARGADVLSGARGGTGTGGLSVTITTGPVMQLGGERYVTIDQAQQMVRDGIGATIRQLRTPAGRYATGVA